MIANLIQAKNMLLLRMDDHLTNKIIVEYNQLIRFMIILLI